MQLPVTPTYDSINQNNYYGPQFKGINLQNAGNLFMENIIYFHNFLICIMVMIVVLVSWFLIRTLLFFGKPELAYKINKIFQIVMKIIYFILDVILYYLYITLYSYLGKLFNMVIKPYLIYYTNFIINLIKKDKKIIKFNKNKIKYPTIDFSYKLYLNKLEKDKTLYFTDFLNMFEITTYNNFNEYIIKNDLNYRYYFYSDVKLEFLWTIFPALILAILAIPSFSLLFSIQKFAAPEITVKVIGHQWYWEYQFMDFINYKKKVELNNNNSLIMSSKKDGLQIFEAYMIQDEDLDFGHLRLLEVDNKLYLPINTSIRFLITSDDVLHSWAVPSLGIKVDACPGRLNELIVNIKNVGTYYGQCSELCGWYHGFMPIVIQSLVKDDFKSYIMSSFLNLVVYKNEK